MKWSFLLFSSFLCLQAFAQYPATGNKARLGWQTTGDGLIYRGAIGDTATLDPSGINNAWMLLDTSSGNLYAYRAKAWRLVSGGGGLTMPFDSVTFNVNETDASLRELKYSEEKGYLQYGGQDSVQIPILPGIWYVRNDTSVTIPKGTVLRATGTLGASGRIKVKHMIANGSIDAMYIIGIAMHDIAVGADGYAMSQGKIRQVNTQAYSEGAVLYADVDTLGGLTQTEPGNGFLKLPIAFVVHSASNGVLAVRVTSGAYMRDLHDVEVTSPATNASLYYNTAQGIWRDTGAAVLVADTAAMLTNYINVADTATMLSSYISNADTSVFARDFQISGTTNYLAKFTGSNAVGNSGVFESGGNVGIGTASPTAKFDLRGGIYQQDGDVRLAVSSGNVGISTGGAPESKLHLGSGGLMIDGPGTLDPYLDFRINTVKIWTIGVDNSDSDKFKIADGGGTNNLGSGDKFTIDGSGNVGIATASPSRPLHVNANSSMIIPSGATGTRPTSGASGDIRYNTSNANFEWHTGTAWREPVNAARSPNTVGLANRFSKFDANGLLDTSAILIQANNRIGIFNSPAAGDSALTITGGIRTTTSIRTGSDATINGMTVGLGASNVASNLAFGNGALASWDGTGSGTNVAIGALALNLARQTLGASSNLAIGGNALRANTNTANNVAIGADAMRLYNKTGAGAGGGNVAIGGSALYSLIASSASPVANNVAIGLTSMFFTQNSDANACIGTNSMRHAEGNENVAIGQASLASSDPGTPDYRTGINQNVSIGAGAMQNIVANTVGNVAIGKSALSLANYEGDNGVYIGLSANASSATATNEIVIGANTTGNGSNTTTIGNSSTTKTFFQYGKTYIGTATDNGEFALQVGGTGYFSTGLRVDYTAAFDANTIFQMPNTSTKAAKGYAWNTYSDARIKSNFDTIQNALQAVQALKPVYYDQHDSEVIDGKIKLQDGKTRTVGFIAQDVAPVIPAAVQAGNDTQLWGMDYTKLIPYLTKAIQEQQAQIEALKKEIEALKNK